MISSLAKCGGLAENLKGARLVMRFQTWGSVSRQGGFVAGMAVMFLTAGALAGPTISSSDVQSIDGTERVRVHWDEPTAVEVQQFPATRQVIVTIPGATLAEGASDQVDASTSSTFEKIRLVPVTTADGAEAVQLTATMRTWQTPTTLAGARWLTIGTDGAASSRAVDEKPVLLSNADIEAMEAGTLVSSHGSSYAPRSGAGQDAAATPTFFVPPNLTAEEKAASGQNDEGLKITSALLERTVDLDFKDADLQNVIRSIAAKLELNIIMTPDLVNGRTSMTLRGVKLADALEALLKSRGLAYKIERGGIIRIVDRDEVRTRKQETVTRSIAINWVDSKDLQTVLKPFVSDEVGEIQSANSSNVIILEDVPEKVVELEDLINRLDIPEKQVRMEVRLVDMTDDAARGLGLRTNLISDRYSPYANVGNGQIKVDQTDDILGARLPYIPNSNPDSLIGNYILPSGTTLTETVTSLVDPAGRPAGTSTATTLAGSSYNLLPRTEGAVGGSASVPNPNVDISNRQSISIFGSRYDLDTRLTAAETRQEAVTLASPTVLTLNNQTAEIEITQQVPYLDATNTDQGSVASISFQDLGTKVSLTPRITNNGFVTMNIEPNQSISRGPSSTGALIIDERRAVTSVTVRDEQTVALGGLRQFSSQSGMEGVPYLMKAPIIGWLFRTTTNSQSKTEMWMFVTPSILKDPSLQPYEQGIHDKINYNWDLPDYYFDEVKPRQSPLEADDPFVKR